MHLRKLSGLAAAGLLAAGCSTAPPAPQVGDLRANGLSAPLGVEPAPTLSWVPVSPERGAAQSAYRIVAASSPEQLARGAPDLWDSGRVASTATLAIPYGGLRPSTAGTVFWQVQIWDEQGRPSPWSSPTSWTAGVIPSGAPTAEPPGWRAQWITDPGLRRWERPQWGYHSEMAKDPDTVKWVQIDLGAPMPIDLVRLYALRYGVVEGTGFPPGFKIEAAAGPTLDASTVITDCTAGNYPNPWLRELSFPAPAGAQLIARYVRLTATHLRVEEGEACLAFSQIEILSGGKNVAAGARVTASDSLEQAPWSAAAMVDGLGIPGINPDANATRLFRREFFVRPVLRRAVLNVCGLGQYRLTINGRSASPPGPQAPEALFAPGWTDYERTCLYDTFDVTSALHPGANAIGLELSSGMFNVQFGRYVKFTTPFRPLTAIAQLRLEYSDGTVDWIGTDGAWRVAPGPLTFANVYGGEDFDARLVPQGWNQPQFNDAGWHQVAETSGPGGQLRGADFGAFPIGRHESLAPVKKTSSPTDRNLSVADLGQNASLIPRIRVRGPAGSVVRITPAELLKPDDSIDRGSVGGGPAWWQYTLAGDPAGESWSPAAFYHGARYLQVELRPAPGSAVPPKMLSLGADTVRADAASVGEFACSNELFNRIDGLIRWAERNNLMSVLTDCPHRERLGWLEQDYLNGPSLRYNFDLAPIVTKEMNDIADSQRSDGLVPDIAPEYVKFTGGFRDSPEWGSAVVQCAWQQYLWTGDAAVLARNYETMARYVAYLGSRRNLAGLLDYGLGDWYDLGPNRPGVAQLTPVALTATATYFFDLVTMEHIARLLGRSDDALDFERLASATRIAFNREFFDSSRGRYAAGSQTANAMPLALGLVPEGDAPRVLASLVADIRARGDALTAGDIGYVYVLRALAAGGRSDVVYAMNNQSDHPGYGFQLKKGATALTESWDAGPSSQDHFMLGQLMEWFYHDLAGIGCDPDGPGFKKIIIHPAVVGDLAWARASYDSVRGRIVSEWHRTNTALTLHLVIPANTAATVFVPATDTAGVREHGVAAAQSPGVRFLRSEPGYAVYAVAAGSYDFTAPWGS